METGHAESRLWTSADGDRSEEIAVYLPASIAGQSLDLTQPGREAAAERALHSLRGNQTLEPLAATLLRSEGIASSRIEGEVASTRRVYEAEYAPEDVSDQQAARIVNSIRVMEEVVATADRGTDARDLDHWHELLFTGVPVPFEPGEVRKSQNWIGGRTDSPVGAEFVPPPPELVGQGIADLTEFVNRVDVAPVAQAAIAHSQFETIHPYPDGNGRVGRALVYRSLAYRGAIASVAPPISRILVERRDAYVDGLTKYRLGEVDAWLDFFFDVVGSAVAYTLSLARAVDALNADWLVRLAGSHEDALARRIAADLSIRPVLVASDVASRYEVTERGARAALDDLVERGVLTHRPFRKAKRGRPAKVYEATEFFELLDRRPQDLA